jgi:hypothetical protein
MTIPCSNPPSLLIPIDSGNESCPRFLLLKPPGMLYLPPLFPSLPAARLLRIELEISQLPPATPSNSGEFPFFLYPYLAPFNCISHADPPRHDDLLACALEPRVVLAEILLSATSTPVRNSRATRGPRARKLRHLDVLDLLHLLVRSPPPKTLWNHHPRSRPNRR